MRGNKWLGTRPLVLVGFLKSWLAGGLNHKVVNHVLEAVRQCKQQSKLQHPVRVFVTGGLPVQHVDVCATNIISWLHSNLP